MFHPSLIERIDAPDLGNTQLLNDIKSNDAIKQVLNLQPVKSYEFTKGEKDLPDINTDYLFRNLYGNTLLTDLFFSRQNVDNIQNILKFRVYKQHGEVIDKQSPTELLIVMRAIFLQFSKHPRLIVPEMSDEVKNVYLKQYTAEVDRLNKLVADEQTPKIVNSIQQYYTYLYDSSRTHPVIDRPQDVSIKGKRELRTTTQVLAGSEF